MSGCTVQRLEAPGLTYLKVSGTIDESFSAGQLSQQIRADTILHLGKVSRFSSFGVREWVRLMKDLQGRVKNCIMVECSPAVVNQLNMVVDFAAGAHVKSIQLPFACQMCEQDKVVTVDIDAQRQDLLEGRLPLVPCPQCQNPMVFDDIPSAYLAFLRDAAAPEPGSPMAAFIASFEQAAPKLAEVASPRPGTEAPPMASPVVSAPAEVEPRKGTTSAVRWLSAAAVVLVVAGAGWVAYSQLVPPPQPVVEAPPPPPPAPSRRDLTSQEVLELTTMLQAESFDKAEAFINSLQPTLREEAKNQAASLVKKARLDAMEKHLMTSRVRISEGRLQEGRDELNRAIQIGGESEQTTSTLLQLERKAGNCPAVIAATDALEAGYPESTFLREATAAKKTCLTPPVVPLRELKKALAAVQADIDGCLRADQMGASIDLAWTVSPSGETTQVSCITPSMVRSTLCQCLTEQVRRLRFSTRSGTRVRRGAYTFTTTSG